MNEYEMRQALKIAQDRDASHKGIVAVAFVLTAVLAYYAPSWVWFTDGGLKNVILFFVVDFAITATAWWLFDRATIDKEP
ncbi:MAG: hypothetical protein Q7U28_07960 [Aquabacterium sp.]|nr:hypothetical protein [Aquabacterium sp.]